VKPRRVDLVGATKLAHVVERVLRIRHEEVLALAAALQSGEPQALHDFRIACKRFRYALERFSPRYRELELLAEKLAAIQDALGEAHDRDVLLAILPPTMPETERRLSTEREEFVARAAEIWKALETEEAEPLSGDARDSR
jgi:CHAD domain-containing protein